MRLTQLIAITSIILISFAGESFGSIVSGNSADKEIHAGGFNNGNNNLFGGGYRGGSGIEVNAVMVFDVSGIVPGTVTSANLNVYLYDVYQAARIPNATSIDFLFGGFSSTADPATDTPSELQFSNDGSGTKIADNVVNDTASDGQYYSSGNSTALVSALNSRATNGSQNYLYTRLAHDTPADTSKGAQGFLWASGAVSDAPYISYETGELVAHMPEPTSLATWLVLAAIPVGLWRRREDG